MSTRTLVALAGLSYEFGLIGADEYEERIKVAHWLSDGTPKMCDPREPKASEQSDPPVPHDRQSKDGVQLVNGVRTDEPDWIKLVVLSRWYFTRSDPDPYPSAPHGHLQSATRQWPKLNPYTGRVFKAKHQEDINLRLKRSEMRLVWQDEAFRDFCRSHILWYIETHSQHVFKVRHPLRFPRW